MPGRAGRAHRRDHLPEQLTTQLRLIPVTVRPAARAARIYRGGLHVHACPPGRRALARPASQACRISLTCVTRISGNATPLLGLRSPDRAVELPAWRRHQPASLPVQLGPRTVRDIIAAFEIAWQRAIPHAEYKTD